MLKLLVSLLLSTLSFSFKFPHVCSLGIKLPKTSLYSTSTTTGSIQSLLDSIDAFERLDDLGYTARAGSDDDIDLETKPLLSDIDRLTTILGELIQRENPTVFELYKKLKQLALDRANGDRSALTKMISCVDKISADEALGVTRAFTQTLNLINAAEVHHRMRRLRAMDVTYGRASPLPMREDSVCGTIFNLLTASDDGLALDESPKAEAEMYLAVDQNRRTKYNLSGSLEQRKKLIFEVLLKQNVDIVLTAHPTEVNRRTLLMKYRSITEILASLDRNDLSEYERQQTNEKLR